MKGVFSTLQLMILTVISLLIAITLIQVASNNNLYAMAKEGKHIIGNPGEITYVTTPNPGQHDPLPGVHIYPLSDWEPFRPSEIACLIADKIFEDYKTFGPDGDRGTICAWHPAASYRTYCLVGDLLFNLTNGKDDEINWENTLTARDCKLCKNDANIVVPELDEICINANLDRTIGESTEFCHGLIPDSSSISTMAFSNENCFNGNSVSGWDDSKCKAYCGNVKGGQSSGFDYATNMFWWFSEKDDPNKYKVKDTVRTGEGNTNLVGKDAPYMYGIFWYPDKKKYVTFFERVPLISYQTDFNFLTNEIKDINDNWQRLNSLGYATSKARRVIDTVVIPGNDKILMTLMGEVSSKLDFPIYQDVGSCGNQIVFCSNPATKNCLYYQECKNKAECIDNTAIDSVWVGCYALDSPSKALSTFKEYDFRFMVNESIRLDGKFSQGKMYRVTVDNWIHVYPQTGNAECTDCKNDVDKIDKTISFYPISDTKPAECCKGTLSLSLGLGTVGKGQPFDMIASGLNYCDYPLVSKGTQRGKIYFFDTPCSGHTTNDAGLGSCTINNQLETLYCLTDETSYKPHPKGCRISLTSPNTEDDYTYYACVDKDGDGQFNGEGETDNAKITVTEANRLECKMVSGGCGQPNGQTLWSSDGDTANAKCDTSKTIAAVKCPTGYKVFSGECRQAGGSHAKLGDSCPTTDIDDAMSKESCEDWVTPGMYDWWFCDWDEGTVWQIAYANCCRIV